MKILHGSILAAGLIAGTLLAQQETVKMGQMMKEEMKGKASKDMDGHREMTQLVDKLAASLTAMEGERDPEALEAKMAQHRKLIEQLRALIAKHGEMMSGMMKTEPVPEAEPEKNPEKHDPEKPADPHAGHH